MSRCVCAVLFAFDLLHATTVFALLLALHCQPFRIRLIPASGAESARETAEKEPRAAVFTACASHLYTQRIPTQYYSHRTSSAFHFVSQSLVIPETSIKFGRAQCWTPATRGEERKRLGGQISTLSGPIPGYSRYSRTFLYFSCFA